MTIKRFVKSQNRAIVSAFNALAGQAHILKATALCFAVFGFPGCGEHDEPPELTKQAVKFDDVPENVRNAATKAVPGVKLNEAWKNLGTGGKLHSYEIRGKNATDGKTREARVSLTGEILETE